MDRVPARPIGAEIPGFLRTAFPWIDVLRSHCAALDAMPAGLVSALSVTAQLTSGTPAEAAMVEEVAGLLASEYGLTATVQINGSKATVRLSRATPEHEPQGQRTSYREPAER
jgi:hypothetical protein